MRENIHPPTACTQASRFDDWPAVAIQRSHERSETFGLRASCRPDYDVLPNAALVLAREQNRVLCAHALPVMETLYGQIVDTHSMIVLTDASGLILHSVGDDDFLRRAEKVALRPGANWAENRQGTNAIGTALAERRAMVVHGDEHYLAANRFLTCSSVPILDPRGDLIGVLDVTGDYRSYHQHTMALAKMSVQMIENHLFTSTFGAMLQVSFHGRPEFLGTLMEGIAAFTSEGRFLSANRSAQFQLGLSLAELNVHTLRSLFQIDSAQLIGRARESPAPYLMLTLCNGATVCARVQPGRAVRPAAHGMHTTHVKAQPRDFLHDGSRANAPQPQPAPGHSQLDRLDTGDPQIAALIAKIRRVLGKDIPVLLAGETGTGKELFARAMHADSPRRAGPFVALNCASIPEALIESELFGYEEGAFTGARRKGAPGKLRQASGGTLFLDEIGDMPYALQTRLLRVLQERVVDPLGSDRARAVDIAVVCATHRDLREMIAQNRFRKDLYYRLNGLTVHLPPLRARTDLAVVVRNMLQRESCMPNVAWESSMPHASSIPRAHRSPLRVAPDVMALFGRCTWPGNFRQLGNLLRTAAAMTDDDGLIRREHLPDDFFDDLDHGATQALTAETVFADRAFAPAYAQKSARLQDVAASVIAATLARHGGNVSAAARALGVSRNTIYRKMAVIRDGKEDR